MFTNLDDIKSFIIEDARARGVNVERLAEQLDILIRTARGHGHSDSYALGEGIAMGRDAVYSFGYGSTFGRAALSEVIPASFSRGVRMFLESNNILSSWTKGDFEIPKSQIKFMLEAQGLGLSGRRFMKMDFMAQQLDEYMPQGSVALNLRRGLRGAANVTAELSGLNPITQWTEEMAMRVNAYANVKMMLAGEAPNEARLSQMGLTKADWGEISSQLQKHMRRAPGENGVDSVDLNFGEWDNQLAVAKFMNAMYTEVVANVTRGDRADLPQWFHKSGLHQSMGNLLLQFRRFGISAHRNVLTRNMKAGDGRAGMMFLTSMMGGLMTYVLSNMFAYQDTPDGRARYRERMSLRRLAMGAISRSPFSGACMDVANPVMSLMLGVDAYGNSHRYGISDSTFEQVPFFSWMGDLAGSGRALIEVGTGQREFEDYDWARAKRTIGWLKHPVVQPVLREFE